MRDWYQIGLKMHLSRMKLILLFWIALGHLYANNLKITNISATTDDISFDISWDNSWNVNTAPLNWDAVWVFVKYQDCATEAKRWKHLLLSDNSGDHTINGGLQVDAVADRMGVFIRQSSTGTGSVTGSCTLTFASAFSSINDLNFEVFGIEMVYVPPGAFYAGDGSTATPPLSQNSMGTDGGSATRLISSENQLSANALSNTSFGAPTQHALIPADFPKGYAAFYCMKYEISQDQYIRFLNQLTSAQQVNRTASLITSASGTLALAPASSPNRNGIRIKTPATDFPPKPAVYGADLNNNGVFNEAEDGGSIACNYLSWQDLLAFLDWAALRPMTELEFEKAARGPAAAVVAAYVWNTTNITQTDAGSLNDAGEETEESTNSGNGLCAYNSGNSSHGPLRVGFAATAMTDREEAGAGYYGIFDLSGNVWEQCYHIGHTGGAGNGAQPIFEGDLGDGNIDDIGNANAPNWGGGQNSAWRSVVRGGNWNQGADYCKLSNRGALTGAGTENAGRVSRTGGRGVRQF